MRQDWKTIVEIYKSECMFSTGYLSIEHALRCQVLVLELKNQFKVLKSEHTYCVDLCRGPLQPLPPSPSLS